MNSDGIGVRRVDSRRVKQIGNESAERFIAPPRESIGEVPPDKLKEMRPGNRRNSAPKNSSNPFRSRRGFRRRHREVSDALRIEINVDTVFSRQLLQQFGENAFCAMLLVDERRDDRKTQLRESNAGGAVRRRIAPPRVPWKL